jgi:hypothetical protein
MLFAWNSYHVVRRNKVKILKIKYENKRVIHAFRINIECNL